MKLSPFEAFQIYNNLKLHFKQPSYDYFRYAGKSRLKESNFDANPNNLFALKICKHKDVENFILANIMSNPNIFIRELAYDPSCEKVYIDWLKHRESLSYILKNELDSLDLPLNEACRFISQHPQLLQAYLSSKISLESIALVLDIVGLVSLWDKKMADDLVWQKEGLKIKKYIPFLPRDKSNFRKIIVDNLKKKNDK